VTVTIRKISILVLIIIFGLINSCGTKQTAPVDLYPYFEFVMPFSELITEETESEPVVPTRAEIVMNAIIEAYPDLIEKCEFRNDDWAVLLRGTWYYFAEGRLLPENQLENASEYRSYQFYNYPEELPPWKQPSSEDIERFKTWTANRSQTTIKRSDFFLNDLWQATTRTETENQLLRFNFLGRPVRLHKLLHDKMITIETQIRTAARTNPQVQTWIDSLGSPAGFAWRNIADTQSRSYHSYGIAIDLLPRALGSRQAYWFWTSQHRADWWNVSYNDRYHPPAAVIRIFEDNGFIWGGKWVLFDTMHFEYRPEILVLNGMLQKK